MPTEMSSGAAPEAAVVHSLKIYLSSGGLESEGERRIVVDAHPSYASSPHSRQLEPMACVEIDGRRPDLLMLSERPSGQVLRAFEVKARGAQWREGLSQAQDYRTGVHYSYLALPAPERESSSKLRKKAEEARVGVLLQTGKDRWELIQEAPEPQPQINLLARLSATLQGLPLARRLGLNHPLNALIVPVLVQRWPELSPVDALARDWPDLNGESSRKMAVSGAQSLGLIDAASRLTLEGEAVADLIKALGFPQGVDKRRRLMEASPALAAIARFVLLRQPAVRLIRQALEGKASRSISELLRRARELDRPLAGALFLREPGLIEKDSWRPAEFSNSTAYQLKQNLWHAGLLGHKAMAGAGKSGDSYRPEDDIWSWARRLD